jgi:hypothetical protein
MKFETTQPLPFLRFWIAPYLTHISHSPGSDVTQGTLSFHKIPSHSKREQTVALYSESKLFWESPRGLAVCKQPTEAKQVQGYLTQQWRQEGL